MGCSFIPCMRVKRMTGGRGGGSSVSHKLPWVPGFLKAVVILSCAWPGPRVPVRASRDKEIPQLAVQQLQAQVIWTVDGGRW